MDNKAADAGRTILAVALVISLAGCSTTPHSETSGSELADARVAYARAQADPSVAEHASEALAHAKGALLRAERAADEGASPEETAHLAYLVERHVEIARADARQRIAEQEIEALTAERASRRQESQRFTKSAIDEPQQEALRAHDRAQSARETALAAQLARDSRPGAATAADVQQLEADLAALEVQTASTQRGLVVVLEEELFLRDEARPTEALAAKLTPLASFLTENPERQVIIEGHTDNQMPLSQSLRLSQARADAVRSHLIEQGVDGARIQAQGYGPDEPVASNESAAGQAENRRVELIIAPGS